MRLGVPTQAARVQSMVSHGFSFFLFFHLSDCAGTTQWHLPRQWQPHNGDTMSSAGSSTLPHDLQQPDSNTTSSTAGSEAGCSTLPQDMQPPNVDMTSSAPVMSPPR